ncbi:MAG: PAS domain S-box protein [Thermodesulfobacteriota bacterium]
MNRARIMVVEDEGIIAEDIQESLLEMGYNVTSVISSGEEALQRVEQERPDLVLMDVVLQGNMDGIEAARRIRSRINIPIIYLTAYTDAKMLERAKATEPFAYMIKPFRERELHTNIEMALFKHELDRRLRESQEWFSGILDSMGHAVIAADRSAAVRFMNPMAQRITGWSVDEAAGRPLGEVFVAWEDKTGASIDDLVEKVIERGQTISLSDVYNTLSTRDGSTRAIDAGAAPVRDARGTVIGMVIVWCDVTDRKRAEEHLLRLGAAVEQSSEGLAVVDLEGRLLFLNKAFAEMHGATPEDLVGHHLSVFHNEEQMAAVDAANRRIHEQGAFSGEIWHTRRDGSTFPGLMHNTLLRDGNGKPIGMVGTLRDITDIKAAAEALHKSHEQLAAHSSALELKVQERTKDLEESKKELKRYSESLEKTNEALKLVIQNIEEQKKEGEAKVIHNLNLTVKPILDQFISLDLSESARYLLQSLEFNLNNVFSAFGFNLMTEGDNLTPREVRICEMIRSGLSSKQIAKVMEISPQTVLVHRKNIRKKLALTSSKKNLATYLKAHSQPRR